MGYILVFAVSEDTTSVEFEFPKITGLIMSYLKMKVTIIKLSSSYFSEVQSLVGVVEGGELSGAAVQVDEARTERRQETEAVVDCENTTRTVR